MAKRIHNFLTDSSPLVTFDINQGSPLISIDVPDMDDSKTKFQDPKNYSKSEPLTRDPITKNIVSPASSDFDSNLSNIFPTGKQNRVLGEKSPRKLKGLEKEFMPLGADKIEEVDKDSLKQQHAPPIQLPPKDGVSKRTGKAMKNKKGPPVKIFKLSGDSEACIEIGKDFVRIKAGDGSFIIINKGSINAGSTSMNWQMSPEQITYHGLLNQVNPILGMFPISPKYSMTPGPIIALANAFRTNALIASAVGIGV